MRLAPCCRLKLSAKLLCSYPLPHAESVPHSTPENLLRFDHVLAAVWVTGLRLFLPSHPRLSHLGLRGYAFFMPVAIISGLQGYASFCHNT